MPPTTIPERLTAALAAVGARVGRPEDHDFIEMRDHGLIIIVDNLRAACRTPFGFLLVFMGSIFYIFFGTKT